MILTTLLAQLWGPILLAVGVGMFLNRDHYLKIYRAADAEPFAVLTFSLLSMTLGIVHVGVHDAWSTPTEILVSLLGWGLLLKGAFFAALPSTASKLSTRMVDAGVLSVGSALVVVIGAYLTWIAYLA